MSVPMPQKHVSGFDQEQVDANQGELFRALQRCELLDGIFLESVVLGAATTTKIAHKLDRNIRGWIVCDRTAATDIYRDSSDTKFITLHSSAAATVRLWVF